MKTETTYEVAEVGDEPTMFSREAVRRPSTVKFVGKKKPDVYADGGTTTAGYGQVAPIKDCDFTKADAWDRYIIRKTDEAEDREAEARLARSQLDAANAQLDAISAQEK